MLVLLVSFQFPKFSAMHAVATITVATCFSIIIGIGYQTLSSRFIGPNWEDLEKRELWNLYDVD